MVTFAGLSHVGLDVDDLDRSERFYTEALGGTVLWRIEGRRPHFDVGFGEQGLTIFQGDRSDQGSLSARTVPQGVHFAFRARREDVDEILARLAQHDVPVDGPVGHWGSTTRVGQQSTSMSWYFEDPDGYRLEFSVTYPSIEEAQAEVERRGGHVGAPIRAQRQQ